MYDENFDRAAQDAYEKWRTRLMSPTPWSLLDPYVQKTWQEVAYAVVNAAYAVPDVNEMDRGFGNCPHCRAPRVAHCHECLNDIERDAAHAAGWRMDHLSGYGCIAVCPNCRNDKGSSHE